MGRKVCLSNREFSNAVALATADDVTQQPGIGVTVRKFAGDILTEDVSSLRTYLKEVHIHA